MLATNDEYVKQKSIVDIVRLIRTLWFYRPRQLLTFVITITQIQPIHESLHCSSLQCFILEKMRKNHTFLYKVIKIRLEPQPDRFKCVMLDQKTLMGKQKFLWKLEKKNMKYKKGGLDLTFFLLKLSCTSPPKQLFVVHSGWEKCNKIWLVKSKNRISRSCLHRNLPSCVHVFSLLAVCLSPSSCWSSLSSPIHLSFSLPPFVCFYVQG